jgi:Flp pilus assembly protein TadB
MTMLAALSAVLILAGGWLVVSGAVGPRSGRPGAPDSRRQSPTSGGSVMDKARRWWGSLSRARRGWLFGGSLGGVVCYLVTGWVGLLLLLPAFGLVLPTLLADPGNPTVSLLEALDRWLRSLTASVSTGKSIAEALRATATTAPEALAQPLAHAVARLDDRWPVRDVLLGLADELASPDADAVAASLMVAAERGGVGTLSVLRALSGNVQQRLHAWRDIEAERAKPRIVVRQVTMISSGVIALGLLTGRSYFAAYGTPVGQLILIGLGVGYLASLIGLRQVTNAPPRARILVVGRPRMPVAPHPQFLSASRPPEADHGA